MNVNVGPNPQITFAPRCPACGSVNTANCRSKAVTGGVDHLGRRYAAQKQYRKCRACGETFGVVHLKGELSQPSRRRGVDQTI